MNQEETIEILDAVIEKDPSIMAVENKNKQSPTDIAIECIKCPEVIRRFTIVLFGRYQLLNAKRPMYRSSSSEVHAVRDLDAAHVGGGKEYVEAVFWLNFVILDIGILAA